MLNVVMLNVVMLNVVMLNVIMLNVIMLNVVFLSVVAPPQVCHALIMLLSKTAQLRVENSAQTTFRLSLIRYCAPLIFGLP
jgi:hypothetical protein